MNADLTDEQAALSAIYDSASCLLPAPSSSDGEDVYILSPPSSIISPPLSLYLYIPPSYPAEKPAVVDAATPRELLARDVLDGVFRPGEVCLFDLVEALRELTPPEPVPQPQPTREATPPSAVAAQPKGPTLPWTIVPPIVEKKSTFIAHALAITSSADVAPAMMDLLTDKRVARATHNIMAYRIVNPATSVSVHDNDDDGETAAGSRLAHLLEMMDVSGVLVVVSRWYGGVKLGPDRFRLINMAAREVLILGGWVKEREKEDDKSGGKGGKKKKK